MSAGMQLVHITVDPGAPLGLWTQGVATAFCALVSLTPGSDSRHRYSSKAKQLLWPCTSRMDAERDHMGSSVPSFFYFM
jgi:hypothetical protein